jgi:excisionase family DNA binding protein
MKKASITSAPRVEYLSLADLAVYASVCVNTLKSWIARGMPHYKVGAVIRVKRTEFDAWMMQFRVGTESACLDSVWAQVMEEV